MSMLPADAHRRLEHPLLAPLPQEAWVILARTAVKRFCHRVEIGEIRSHQTYRELKSLLNEVKS